MGVFLSPSVVAKKDIAKARKLRRAMTQGERKLWDELREFRKLYGIHARKQVPIGPYVVDFVVHAARVAIEVDGHFHETPERKTLDAVRDARLGQVGYRVLRFTTGELEHSFDGCIEEILRELGVI